MDIMKAVKVIGLISEKTSSGQIKWERTASEDSFQTKLGSFIVRISVSDEDFFVSLFNAQGELMDRYQDDDFDVDEGHRHSNEMHEKMAQIFYSARRSALGVEKALDAILDELNDDVLLPPPPAYSPPPGPPPAGSLPVPPHLMPPPPPPPRMPWSPKYPPPPTGK